MIGLSALRRNSLAAVNNLSGFRIELLAKSGKENVSTLVRIGIMSDLKLYYLLVHIFDEHFVTFLTS